MKKLRTILSLLLLATATLAIYRYETTRDLLRDSARRMGVDRLLAERDGGGFGTIRDRVAPPSAQIPWEESLAARQMELGWKRGGEVFVRIFKQENVLEIFGRHQGRWELLKSWPICRWSGKLGPKHAEGDRQAPEGFYMVSKRQLNPHSKHHLAFNLGFPNKVEKAQGKTGSYLMVHGNCASIGCYAMTNPAIDEIYRVVEEALNGGQKNVPVHAFPFRLTEDNLSRYRDHTAYQYWLSLKPGYDAFERERAVPIILACGVSYGFGKSSTGSSCEPLRGW